MTISETLPLPNISSYRHSLYTSPYLPRKASVCRLLGLGSISTLPSQNEPQNDGFMHRLKPQNAELQHRYHQSYIFFFLMLIPLWQVFGLSSFSLLWGESEQRIRLVVAMPLPANAYSAGRSPAPTLERKERTTFMKNKKMSIRISENHLTTIHSKAEQAKLTFTDYVTKACLGKQIFVVDGLNNILREQKAIGRNINQIATLANMGKVKSINLSELTQQYTKLNEQLTALLDRKRWG